MVTEICSLFCGKVGLDIMCENEAQNKTINLLYSFDTEYTADSVEWCPHEAFHNIFVCANYQLAEQPKDKLPCERVGRILLFSISTDKGLDLNQTLETDAVLDQKWCHTRINGFPILGVVDAKNKLKIYKLLSNVKLVLLASFEFEVSEGSELLILSLDWSTGKFDDEAPEIVCSDSKGFVHILKLSGEELTLEKSYDSHGYEAWIAAFYYWDPNVFFSGGDDCLFVKYDKRVEFPVSKNSRTHEAGVTSMHSNKQREHILATGSYDQHLRLWDIRNIKNPLSSTYMPGPLWRVKWDPFTHTYVLCACMLGGVHIVDTKHSEKPDIIGSFYEHKNIAYGADWSYLNVDQVNHFEQEGNAVIGTCSFYDHLLCVSKCNIKR